MCRYTPGWEAQLKLLETYLSIFSGYLHPWIVLCGTEPKGSILLVALLVPADSDLPRSPKDFSSPPASVPLSFNTTNTTIVEFSLQVLSPFRQTNFDPHLRTGESSDPTDFQIPETPKQEPRYAISGCF